MSGLQATQRDGVLWLVINRPQVANALHGAVRDAYCAALQQARGDGAIRAVVQRGTGERVFCAGVDQKTTDGLQGSALRAHRSAVIFDMVEAALDFPKPLVSAVNGVASGGGLMLALLADAVLAEEHAAFVLPEIDLGIPSYLAAALLADTGPLAADLVLSGRRLTATEAERRGLVRLASPGQLDEAAQAAAQSLAAKPPQAYAAVKAFMQRTRRAAVAEARRTAQGDKE